MKTKAIARNTLKFEDYLSPSWIKGKTYEAVDDGTVLWMSGEKGDEYRFLGDVREFMLSQFDFLTEEDALESKNLSKRGNRR